jgi:hypothetical protein
MNRYSLPFGKGALVNHVDNLHLMRADTHEIARGLTLIINGFNRALGRDAALCVSCVV